MIKNFRNQIVKNILTREIPTVQPTCIAAYHLSYPQKEHKLMFIPQCFKKNN